MLDNTKLTEVIAQRHQELDELFLLHQEAILLEKFDAATKLLSCFKELHALHVGFEDKQLIPKLDGLVNQRRWPASLYTSEHAKIHELMEETEKNLLSLSKGQLSNQDLRREIIALLDKEKTFKGLCEHHQEREEKGIFPELDKQTDEKWRIEIIKPFLKEWNCCMKSTTEIVNGINFP
jgi:hemerythrin-like domain-containing protein|tara:strand:+ start:343 stop:879 length:537 start_codon:yes stop_codon:yes gene_type:complete